jgi:molybdopterin-binding protein
MEVTAMQLSARNQLRGRVKDIRSDDIASEIVIDIGGQEVCSTITAQSAQRLGLKTGDEVTAVIKASNVMIMK